MGRVLLLAVLLVVLQLTLAACDQGAAIPAVTSTPLPSMVDGNGGAWGPKSGPGSYQPVPSTFEAVGSADSEPNLANIAEPAAREALRMVEQAGPGEVVPGFGGLFLDADDKSIVYVYMLDPSEQEAAEQAVRIILSTSRLKNVTEVRVLQGDYSWGQLLGWYREAQDVVWQIAGIQSSGIKESRNRITFTMQTSYAAEQALEALAETDVLIDAVIFNVAPKSRLDDPPVQLQSPISVNISLDFVKTVPAGQPVSIEVVLTNEGDGAVEFEHNTPYHENVMIFAVNGDQVWAKIRGGVLVGTGGNTKLLPGEKVRLQTIWDQRDQDGFKLPAGRYLVRGTARIGDHPTGRYRAMNLATEPYELVIQP